MSDQTPPRSTADWLVDLCVYAPIGFALDAHKYVPEFVDRGRNQVALARFLGKFALDRIEGRLGPLGTLLRTVAPGTATAPPASGPAPDQAATPPPAAAVPASTAPASTAASAAASSTDGTASPGSGGEGTAAPSAPQRTAATAASTAAPTTTRARRAASSGRAAGAPTSPGRGAPKSAGRAAAKSAGGAAAKVPAGATKATPGAAATAPRSQRSPRRAAATAGHQTVPNESQLAIEGYGSLAASQIVPRLTTLDATALDAIGRFEAANRARRTILNRVEQLRAGALSVERARPADAADLPRLLALTTAAHDELLGERGGPLWSVREAPPRPRDGELAAALEDPQRAVIVGTFADYAAGYGAARLEVLRDGRLLAVVTDIYVEPPFRGVAVGEAIMDELLAWAARHGCSGVDSLVLPGMRESKNFFERYGMKARALLVHRDLDDEQDRP